MEQPVRGRAAGLPAGAISDIGEMLFLKESGHLERQRLYHGPFFDFFQRAFLL